MKIFAVILMMFLAGVSHAQMAYYNQPLSRTFTAADDTFVCARSYAVAFLAFGNCGQYAEVAELNPAGGIFGDTVQVYSGVVFQLVTPGKINGDYWVGQGNLTSFITSNGDTLAPFVVGYKVY